MTRGQPAVWSTAFGVPLLALGVYVYGFQSEFQLVANQPEASPAAGLPLVLFGLFVIGIGLYVEYVAAPDAMSMRDGESLLDTRTPALRNALGQAFAGLPVLLGAAYLLFFETYPYVYPTVAFAAGLYLFSTGLLRYWRNTLTRYLVTNQRVVKEYWFLSVVRNEIPFEKVRAVQERRTLWDALYGIGSVAVRSGSEGSLTIEIDGVYESEDLAELIRDQLERDGRREPASDDGRSDGDDGAGDDAPPPANDGIAAGAPSDDSTNDA